MEEGRRRKRKKIFFSQRRRRTVKEKEEKDGRKSKPKNLNKKEIIWTCLLVRNEPASTLLLSWRPHPSPCLPGSRFPKIDHRSLFSFHNTFSHIFSLCLYFSFVSPFLFSSFFSSVYPSSLCTSTLPFCRHSLISNWKQFRHDAHLPPGKDDEDHGDEHHEQLEEPLDQPLALLGSAHSRCHRPIRHFQTS